ncbi:MAG: glycosyltransferase family 39 protein [Isosphaeraceae bacterium]
MKRIGPWERKTMPKDGMQWVWRRTPEIILAILAGAVFLLGLGSVDLWGKREQRASAEAIDTVEHQHWLVAEIQGRPRLEKPPLPRWTIATLFLVTGQRDEWVVRLPSVLSALGMIALVVALGKRMSGRSAGLAAGFFLTSIVFFITELRQAGNDGLLAFFTTLALYAAWRRLHAGTLDVEASTDPPELGSRSWSVLMYLAMGLGFLTKGPVILVLVALTILPYLATAGRLRTGVRALIDWRGVLLLLLLILSWPVPVLLSDPNAARVWYLEMAQKAGTAGITHHRKRDFFAMEWPGMTAPWVILAAFAVALPFRKTGRGYRPMIWFPWSWTVANLAMFCLWKVAKPNYYLPCLPGVALLTGIEWVRLTQAARELGREATQARRILQVHWVALFVAALVAPVVVGQVAPEFLGWSLVPALTLAASVVLSALAWRRGNDVLALAPLVASIAVGVGVIYGAIGPRLNARYSHRSLAEQLERELPADTRTVMFYRELDEGLWFYLHGRDIVPVPNSQPRYNRGADLLDDFERKTIIWDDNARIKADAQVLIDWLQSDQRQEEYVLIRTKIYDLLSSPKFFGPELGGLAQPVLREENLNRHEVVLLHAPSRNPVASGARRPRR